MTFRLVERLLVREYTTYANLFSTFNYFLLMPKGKKKKCLVYLPKANNAVKNKQFSTVRPMNANPVYITMDVLKNSTHYSIIISSQMNKDCFQ